MGGLQHDINKRETAAHKQEMRERRKKYSYPAPFVSSLRARVGVYRSIKQLATRMQTRELKRRPLRESQAGSVGAWGGGTPASPGTLLVSAAEAQDSSRGEASPRLELLGSRLQEAA